MKKYELRELLTLRRERVDKGKFLIVNGDDFVSNSPFKLANYNYAEFPNEKLKKSGYNYLFRKGDILFLTVGVKQKIWMADQEGVCASGNNKIKIIIPRKEIILPWWLINIIISKELTKWATERLTGTTVPQINWKTFERKKLIIPAISEQKDKIVAFLPLEDYWKNLDKFVAKAEILMNSILYILLPRNAETRKLGDIATFEYGYTAKANDKGKYRFIQTGDIDKYGNILEQEKKYIDLPENVDKNKYLLNEKDIITARHGNSGRTAIFQSSEKTIFTNDLIRINLNKEIILTEYYWRFSQTSGYWNQVKELVGGTAQPQLNANSLKKIIIPIPSIKEQEKIIIDLERETEIFFDHFYSYRLLMDKYIREICRLLWEKETIKLIQLPFVS